MKYNLACLFDFNKQSESVLEYASALAVSMDAELIVVHNIAMPVFTDTNLNHFQNLMMDRIESKVTAILTSIKLLMIEKNSGLKIRSVHVNGLSDKTINDFCRFIEADILLVGADSLNKSIGLLHNNHSSGIVKHAYCPVLIVPRNYKFNGMCNIAYTADWEIAKSKIGQSLFSFAKTFNAQISILFIDTQHSLVSQNDLKNLGNKIKALLKYDRLAGYYIFDSKIENGMLHFVKSVKPDLMVLKLEGNKTNYSNGFRSIIQQLITHSRVPLMVYNSFRRQ